MIRTPSTTGAELIAAAARAPSSHNTQPWWFRDGGTSIELHADRTRGLPVNDPFDRELTISCGAALLHLCAAASASGSTPRVEVFPSPDRDHLATVMIEPRRSDPHDPYDPHDDPMAVLADAIPLRHTHRGSFGPQPVPDHLAGRLAAIAAGYGLQLSWIPPGEQREELAALVAEGDREQFADPSWRRELASWMHPRRRGDGLTVGMLTGAVTRAIVAHVDLGSSTAGKDESITRDAPLVGVLATEGDTESDWLLAGRALGHLLLVAAADGVQAGYANQPCQVAELRPRLRSLIELEGHPQLVVRLGIPSVSPPVTPRRPIVEIVEIVEPG